MKKWFERIFKREISEGGRVEPVKTVKDLQVKDDVFIITNNISHKAWIIAKTRRVLQIHIWDTDKEVMIPYKDREDETIIPYGDNNYVILNEKDVCDYL